MKTIAFNRLPGTPVTRPADVDLIADSALVMPGRPVFIPDFTENWSARIYTAFRVSRLGKSIRPKFAPRYYDAMTLALRLMPDTDASAGFLGLFDNCMTLGTWQPLPAPDAPLRISSGDTALELSLADIDIDGALAAVSSTASLKMGDIIMPCHLPVAPAVLIDSRITAEVDGSTWLDVRLK